MSPNADKAFRSTSLAERMLAGLSAVGTLLILTRMLIYSEYGLDFTDEAFYLVWIANPFIYSASHTQFGFVYHPLYVFLDGDISSLRQANILITYCLAWGLSHVFLTALSPESGRRRFLFHSASAGLSVSGLVLFKSGLVTPSYNSLTMQALMFTGIGLLLANKTATFKSISGWLIIGIGGWLVFMAKPTSAIGLTFAISLYLLVTRRYSASLLFLSIACAVIPFLVSAMLIDGSITGFVQRLQSGAEISRILAAGHTLGEMLRIDSFQLNFRGKLVIIVIFITSTLAMMGILFGNRRGAAIAVIVSAAYFSLTILLVSGEVHKVAGLGRFQGLSIFGLMVSAMLVSLIFCRIKDIQSISTSQWGVVFVFLGLPHIFSLGTTNNYWSHGSAAAIFWLLASLILLGRVARLRATWSFLLPLVLATQAVTAVLLQTGWEQPYRQPQPLRLNQTTLEIGLQQSSLVLSTGYASYISDAVSIAQRAGFKPGTPIIDLTGQSPGILYALGAENLGLAWAGGGYLGSLDYFKAALDLTSCEKIAAAWVLIEPDGPRSISTELLQSIGAIFPDSYVPVGFWKTAEGAGGYAVSRSQELYRPSASSEILNTCEIMRQNELD